MLSLWRSITTGSWLEDKPTSVFRFSCPVGWACVFMRVGTDMQVEAQNWCGLSSSIILLSIFLRQNSPSLAILACPRNSWLLGLQIMTMCAQLLPGFWESVPWSSLLGGKLLYPLSHLSSPCVERILWHSHKHVKCSVITWHENKHTTLRKKN